jgi:hypothetical protein
MIDGAHIYWLAELHTIQLPNKYFDLSPQALNKKIFALNNNGVWITLFIALKTAASKSTFIIFDGQKEHQLVPRVNKQ